MPRGVEVTESHTESDSFLFFLNHLDEPVTLELRRAGTDALSGRTLAGGDMVRLDAAGVLMLRSRPTTERH
ncbi:Beta-galactosidase C-terminal domain [Streptomyces poonensis]|uniref:Beta-galactosidase C-terminal domain n=1 Tax=Streptomyces poonensis TaxID=68255 RepID=UPI00167791F2|nr:Beta-galactosidase C-terminal domain [Streptomyces poonensis]